MTAKRKPSKAAQQLAANNRLAEQVKVLTQRVLELERMLKCIHCGHMMAEHDEDFSPCHGGRTPDMKPGEGYYCRCPGFEAEI